MKFFVVALAIIASVVADVSEQGVPTDYLPPVDQALSSDYLPPADDGYRYKTVKRYRFRHRRDVSELAAPSNEYLPPGGAPANEYLPPVEAEPAHTLGDDGYSYKKVRRVRYRRRRRDVSELAAPSNEYLPPGGAPSNEYLPPAEAEPAHTFGDEGYSYKKVRRVRYRRRRRDVSELAAPSNEYLPPGGAPSNEYLPPAEAEPAHTFGDEGYKYKRVRRVRYRRRRRDVSELAPSNEYLPPGGAPSNEYLPPAEAEPAHTFGDEGYKYKRVRRVRYRRRRRDVSELAPSNEYLPPGGAPSNEYLPPVEAEPAHTFGDEGYKYKRVRRVRYRRRRRDVSELAPSNEYLPPGGAPSNEYLPPAEAEPAHTFGDEGYKYKRVRRVRYRRRRRDVEFEDESDE